PKVGAEAEGGFSPPYTIMCTTMMVLATLALVLRQRFSNSIKPEKDRAKEAEGCPVRGEGTADRQK
ncbi:hypothetical protein CRUP_000814, partial [Coryphaenoides rupestris]